ncbi:MAG: flagellar basal body L-ring protein FlgH [Bordetella sp.]|nr:flagellar basal body L-ring protein FlgH [Bordetella sp.]
MRPITVAALSFSALALTACSTAMEAVKGPELAPIGYPAALVPIEQAYLPEPTSASANSLWRTGARSFFGDQRARRVGDILTVSIDINDRAQTQNSTQRNRTNSASGGVTNFFGLENSLGRAFPGGFDPANMIGTEGEISANGSGSVSRSERVNLTVAAVVTAVMPNGNLVIQGRQEVRTNREVRELTVAGIVRPEDISSANTIRHSQIAEARISYGGRGDISRMQATPAAQSLVERFSPF